MQIAVRQPPSVPIPYLTVGGLFQYVLPMRTSSFCSERAQILSYEARSAWCLDTENPTTAADCVRRWGTGRDEVILT